MLAVCARLVYYEQTKRMPVKYVSIRMDLKLNINLSCIIHKNINIILYIA